MTDTEKIKLCKEIINDFFIGSDDDDIKSGAAAILVALDATLCFTYDHNDRP